MTEETKRIVKLGEPDFQLTEHAQGAWTAFAPAGTKREDPLNPMFWGHVARKIRTMAEIRVMPKDGAWYARYLVLYSDQHGASVKELEFHKLDSIEGDAETELYEVKWRGPAALFGVIRKADKEVMKDGFAAKQAAASWMIENLRPRAA